MALDSVHDHRHPKRKLGAKPDLAIGLWMNVLPTVNVADKTATAQQLAAYRLSTATHGSRLQTVARWCQIGTTQSEYGTTYGYSEKVAKLHALYKP